MPILGPGGVKKFFFSDLVPDVIRKVENRTSKRDAALTWLRDAVLDIAGNPDYRDDFAELELLGELYNLTPDVQEYDEVNLLPTGEVNDATLDIFLWSDPPSNTKRRQLNPTHFQDADRSTAVRAGLPTQWYRFGGNIGFQLVPDLAYQVQARMLRQHPINDASLEGTEILLPRDWHVIVGQLDSTFVLANQISNVPQGIAEANDTNTTVALNKFTTVTTAFIGTPGTGSGPPVITNTGPTTPISMRSGTTPTLGIDFMPESTGVQPNANVPWFRLGVAGGAYNMAINPGDALGKLYLSFDVGGGVIFGKGNGVDIAGFVDIAGLLSIEKIQLNAGTVTGKGLCRMADKTFGYCSTVLDAVGNCTCNAF